MRRVDFAATVRTVGGERVLVLVEVQKARFTDEVMRFREYLGRHYADRENYDEGPDGRRRHRPLRVINILGECLTPTYRSHLSHDVLRLSTLFHGGTSRKQTTTACTYTPWRDSP